MKTGKRLLSVLLACLSIFCVFGMSITAFAEGETSVTDLLEVQTQRQGNKIAVRLVAKRNINNIGGFEGSYAIDAGTNAAYNTYSSALNGLVNEESEYFSFVTDTPVALQAGDALLSLVFELNDAFATDTEYKFSIELEEFFDANRDDFADMTDATTFSAVHNEETIYTVTFYNNGRLYDTKEVAKNKTVAKPTAPTAEGFQHWSATVDGTEFDFDTSITGDTSLYAVYNKTAGVVDKNVDLSAVKLNKHVIAAEGVVVNETFTFKFKSLNQVDGETSPTLSDITITANKSDTFTKDLGNVTFPKGGVYEYEVTEVDNETANWTFDTTKYYLYLTVEENTEGQLVLTSFVITTDADNKDALKKADSLYFENEYIPMTTLKVSNKVEGNPANSTKQFSYTITFTDPGVNGVITTSEGEKDTTTIAYGVPYEFKLGNEGARTFTLPAGTQYTVTEAGETYYTPSVTVTENGVKNDTSSLEGEYEKSLTTRGTAKELTETNENEAEFVNTYSITPPTGLTFNSEMLVIIALVVVAIAGGVVINRKLKKARA